MQDPQDLQAQIFDALRRGATDQALAVAQAAVAARPEDATPHRLLALTQQVAGEHAQALASIERAVALAPEDALVHLSRARLLLGARQLGAASEALATTTALDPNQFAGYMLQALVALGRNDPGEAERVNRLASLVDAQHPYVAAIDGMVALQRGDAERAAKRLAAAVQQLPDDPVLRNALGFAYLAQGHLAFAEQAFRGVIDTGIPEGAALRPLLADLMRQQGRIDDALAELAPLLGDPALATAALRRFAGELELVAKRPQRALSWLQPAFAEQPTDRRTLRALVQVWRELGDHQAARASLDAALATRPEHADLWRARLAFEAFASEPAQQVLERWLAALPTDVGALEAIAALHEHRGETVAAEAAIQRILALEPTHGRARARRIDHLLARAPAAAIDEIQQWLASSDNDAARRQLRGWLGFAQDRAQRCADAVQTWTTLQLEAAGQRPAPPAASAPRTDWPERGFAAADAPAVSLLWGAPGSAVEQIALSWAAMQLPFCTDRFGPTPPQDGLGDPATATRLAAGELEPAALVAGWRQGLAQRGIADGQVVDWLPHWDNALLLALRPHLPEAELLLVLRDPRDMLLDWLAFGAPQPIAMASVPAAAAWLAGALNQVAALHEQDLYPHRLLRLDAGVGNPSALTALVSEAIQTPLPEPPAAALGSARFPAGHWHAYADALAEPFALLAPVARRLGYAEI